MRSVDKGNCTPDKGECQTYRPKFMDSHDDDEGKRAKRKELKEDV